ncbi:hypothetical protein GCL60_17010 (plasmid) [Silvanigrella paludirubra]|uniref:Uncharacterized protein n=1 Tax=Silvanigrella paludirubra TaxID=2499159 RepID=A0A6N6VP32_9BACT|nr:VirB3 family type IV secretion system protein [Silvanigrella paludirubra]KAB8035648.1 hypothetical protein GCL60_17010 [Silvanigrella paludirubra]MBX9837464.1 VirB3 family type IV secretion system protein [Silvanigrellaceae bacterium]
MEDMHVSYVHQSLIRPSVLSSMPSQWFVRNLLFWVLLGIYLFASINFYFSLITIVFGSLTHILLQKAFAKDEKIFSIYYRHFLSDGFISSTTKVNILKENF